MYVSIHPPIHPFTQKAFNSQARASLRLGAGDYIQVVHVGGRDSSTRTQEC